MSKRLRSAFRPGYIAITALWKGVELGNGGGDRELRVSNWKIAPFFYLPTSIYPLRHYVLFYIIRGDLSQEGRGRREPVPGRGMPYGVVGVRVFQKEPKRKVN